MPYLRQGGVVVINEITEVGERKYNFRTKFDEKTSASMQLYDLGSSESPSTTWIYRPLPHDEGIRLHASGLAKISAIVSPYMQRQPSSVSRQPISP